MFDTNAVLISMRFDILLYVYHAINTHHMMQDLRNIPKLFKFHVKENFQITINSVLSNRTIRPYLPIRT